MASLNDIETKIKNIVDILDYRVVTTITGTLPLTFRSNGAALINYRIYGTADGAGVQTENLAPFIDEWRNGYVSKSGTISSTSEDTQERYSPHIAVEPNATYQWSYQTGSFPKSSIKNAWTGIGWYNDDGFISRVSGEVNTTLEIVAPANAKYAILSFRTFGENYNAVFIKSSTPPETYIPYGYKLPLTITSGTESKDTYIYIGDSKMLSGDYVDYESGKIVRNGTPQDPPIPLPSLETYKGTNTLDSAETLGQVTIKGKIKEVN